MNAPNRVIEVGQLIAPYLPFPQGEEHDPYRLKVLLEKVIPGLNAIDAGKWGCLTKTDQGGKVPCDILVWKDTNEVIDCLDSRGAMWDNHGPNVDNPAWVWTEVPDPADDDEGDETNPTPAPNDDALLEKINAMLQAHHASIVTEVNQHLDANVKQLNASLKPVVDKILGA